jgi:hypothetical protein
MFTAPKQQIRSNPMFRTDDPERDLHNWQRAEEENERKYEIANAWIQGPFTELVVQAALKADIEGLDALAQHAAYELEYFYDHVCDELQKPDHPSHFCMSALIAGDVEQVRYWSQWIVNTLEPMAVYEAYHGLN